MKDPKRLFEDGSAFEKSLLRSGRASSEAPSPALEQRILAALPSGPAAAAPQPDAGTPAGAPPSSFQRFFKPRGIVMAVAAIGIAAAIAGARNDDAPAPLPARPAATAGVPVGPAAPPAPPPEVVVTPDSLPTVVIAPAPRASALRAPSAVALAIAPAAAPSLEREIELLDAVKTKLGAGSASDATRALDAYDAEFPSGTLRPEGTVLRVRTLLLAGDRAAATKLADEFLAAHPGSVHGKRMRALLGE